MPTILLIESARSKTSFSSVLERRKYEVLHASTGKQALASAKQHALALIVLDAISSRIDGSRLCRDIRSQLDGIAILLLTRAETQIDPACGADFILAQPFTPRKLLNRVARMLPSGATAVLSAGDLMLNVANRCVRLGKKEHQLTPKQSQLLEIFMRQPNEIITRRDLMKEVWNTDYMGDTRTLDVHIRWLRQIIELDASRPRRLVTVRSVGYKLKI
ncbi:MAG TPA: response regulator transcription factor [Anaerolineae bacterium]|nr:response regulator transcription factor [Anaerolineae bacterium]